MSAVTGRCPFVREKIRIYWYTVRVYHKSVLCAVDGVWSKDHAKAIYDAGYIAGFLAQDVVHPAYFERDKVEFEVLTYASEVVFSSVKANIPTRVA